MGQTESIYDSLDRRQHNRVVLQTSLQSAQYDEPDKEQSVQPLMLPSDQSDSQYYCGELLPSDQSDSQYYFHLVCVCVCLLLAVSLL